MKAELLVNYVIKKYAIVDEIVSRSRLIRTATLNLNYGKQTRNQSPISGKDRDRITLFKIRILLNIRLLE